MIYVYVIRSIGHPQHLYVGQTDNLERRLSEHNSGKSKYTQTYTPWEIMHLEEYQNRTDARAREKYLKLTTGKNFLRKNGII